MKHKVASLIVVAIISTWATFMVVPAGATVSAWDLTNEDSTSYTNCITSLRNDAKDPKLIYFKIPMLPAPGALKPKYLLVDLRGEEGTIILAIDRSNLYLVGYADKVIEKGKEKERALFFQDAPADAKKDLFPNADKPRDGIPYKSSYQSIEGKAGVSDRKNFGLGREKLNSKFKKVYGKDVYQKDVQKNQAEMLLLAVQMVSEATRFSYIENQVKLNFAEFEFIPDYRLIRLENRWDKLSTAIRGADKKTEKFKKSVDLVKPDNTPDPVDYVNQVKDDIALLKYVQNAFLAIGSGSVIIGVVLLLGFFYQLRLFN